MAADDFPIVNLDLSGEGKRRPFQIIICSECQAVDRISAHASRLPAAHVESTFQKRGWLVGAVGKHLCPTCWSRRRLAKRKPESTVSKDPPPRSPAASSKMGLLYMCLSDQFDVALHRYKDGWSDARVAKETELSEQFVADRREKDFGPIYVDTLDEELRAATARLDKADAAFSLVVERLSAVSQDLHKASAAYRIAKADASRLALQMADRLKGGVT